ncbi:MAG TPA: hypothetical protein VGK06_01755 [Methanosarcina sp.]
MLKDIAVGTCVHLLSRIDNKALDEFWKEISAGKSPIIDSQGNLGYSLLSEEEILFIRNDFTSQNEQFELVFGDIFLPDTVQELLFNNKVMLLMVYRKGIQDLLLSEVRMDVKFMLDLPRGQYFFFIFLLDAGAKSLLSSTVYAIGFPSRMHLNSPELETFYLKHPVDIWEFVDPSPIEIKRGGPFYINMIMVNIEQIPGCSLLFSELLQEDEYTPPL